MGSTRRSVLAWISAFAVILASCGSPVPSPPPPADTPGAVTASQPPGSELRIAVPEMPPFGRYGFDTVVDRMIHSALLRYDDTLKPTADLASCVVADAGVTIRCELAAARFHNGMPVGASDVVFSYQLASRKCESRSTPNLSPFLCFNRPVSVEAKGDRTVLFTLSRPDATFMTLVLPNIPIESEAVIRESFARFMARARGADVDALREAASRDRALLENPDVVCEPEVAAAETLLRDIGYVPWNPAEFGVGRSGDKPDYCRNLFFLAGRLEDAVAALDPTLDETAVLAEAYELLDFSRVKPIGAGPFAFESYDAAEGRLVLTARPDYRGRPARTERIIVLRIADPERVEKMLRAGELDWWNSPSWYRDVDWAASEPQLQIARYPSLAYDILGYNVRPGRLFSDQHLREAMEYCIDKESSVDAATAGRGTLINSPIPPASWAHQPLSGVSDGVEFGRKLIEDAGWKLGPDKIYAKDGGRLSFEVLVRNDYSDDQSMRIVQSRLKFLDIAAWKVRRCGIELKPRQVSFDEQRALMNGQGLPDHEEIEASLHGWIFAPDPDDTLWKSSETPERKARRDPKWDWRHDEAANWMGFANADVDRLLEKGRTTYDFGERGRVYRSFQQILANEHPVMFLYSPETTEVLSTALRYRDESIKLTSPRWWWKLEDLVVDR